VRKDLRLETWGLRLGEMLTMDAGQPVPKCLVCGGETEVGFCVDHGYGQNVVQEWWSGEPVNKWYGLKQPKLTRDVKSVRCTVCGFLMSFAV